MAGKIVWTEPAVKELESVVEFWKARNKSTTYSKKIRKVLRQNLKLIVLQPEIGRKTSLPEVKAKLMLQHFFIIYRIGPESEIVILNFWDCRQDPDLNKYIK